MINRNTSLVVWAAAMALLPLGAATASPKGRPAEPWMGEPAITETIAQITARQTVAAGLPLRPAMVRLGTERSLIRMASTPPTTSTLPVETSSAPRQSLKTRRDAPQTTTFSFNGPTISDTPGYTPPDAMGAAGPTQYLVTVNGRFRTYDKTTGVADGALNVDPDVFFASVLTPGVAYNGTTDPRVRYDRLSGRWFIVMIDMPSASQSYTSLGNNRFLIAVSSGPTITAQSSFSFFYFQQNTVSPAGDTGYLADYPTLGVDANALYIGANMYTPLTATGGGAFRGTTGWVVRKSSILGSGPIVATAFRSLATGTDTSFGPGPYTPQGVDNDDPSSTEGYFVGVDNANFGLLVVRRVSNPGGTPTISGNLNITVPATRYPINIAPLGSTCPLDSSGDDRLFAAQIKKNPLTGERTLWTAHCIGVDTSGTASDTPALDAVRWYELKNLTTTPALSQSGTLYDNSGNKRSYTYPAIAMSGQGHVAMSSSTMGPNERTGIALTGRLNGDTAGTMQTVTMAPLTSFNYNHETCTSATPYQRWGDYGFTCVDPNDDMTMWTVQEYAYAINAWSVRVIRLNAPPPATPSACAPSTIAPGTSGSVTITGASSSGSGFFDPGTGFANRLSASVSGAGVTVNGVTYTSPTQISLSLSVTPGTPNGQRSITITNPDGQAVTSATGFLTIQGVPYTSSDVVKALKIVAGILTSSTADVGRYAVVSGTAVRIQDATQIMRKVAGLVANP